MKYLLGCGYHESSQKDREFSFIWARNVERFATPKPHTVAVMNTGILDEGYDSLGVLTCNTKHISCNHNLGHVGALLSGEKNNQLCGWSASFLGLAMLSYNMGLDFVFQEQDCLAFGDYIGQMYRDAGDAKMVFGRKMQSPPWMASAQSLVLVKHGYIPTMIRNYIDQGPDRYESLPEDKFARLEAMDWRNVRRLTFGYDRERPINFDAPVWYAQKFTDEEMAELERRGLV